MSIDQRRGVINLIQKKDKDLRLLKNWRPISLLNTDYKILTKVMAVRLKTVLPSVIHPDQVAYLKGRYIGQNIRTIIDIMDFTKRNDIQGIIAFLDFEKAFDSIDWRIIDEALEKFNIGPVFRKWVQYVYNNITSCVTNCGFSSKEFKVHRGVRQGCPLSAYLFIIVAEILAIKIRTNKDIKGIKIGDTEIKVVQMADDTTSFLKDTDSLEETLNTLEKFRILAGLKLNVNKSEAIWIGSSRNSKEKPLGMSWVKSVKALGIHYSYDETDMEAKNFTEKLKELKKLLAIWGQRDLSILGRIQVFKSLAFSKIIYQCNNLAIPDGFIKELNSLAFEFIWAYKKDKVKRTVTIADYADGGLKMLDVESFIHAQKIMWIKRIQKGGKGSWITFPNHLLSKIIGKQSFQCSTKIQGYSIWMPRFYLQLFEAWNKIRKPPGDDPFKLRREILWHNKAIMIRGKEIYYKKWHEKGILILHDIVNENGDFKELEILKDEFGINISVMEYNSLKSSIPSPWRKALKKMRIPKEAISGEELLFLDCSNRLLALSIAKNCDAYWELVSKKQDKPNCVAIWCNEYNIEAENWKSIFRFYSTIKDTRLKAFQYKILNFLLPCNLYLSRIGRSETDRCSSCNALDDTSHYLFYCPASRLLWDQLSTWWHEIVGQEIIITEIDTILGLAPRQMKIIKEDQLNHIIITVKWKIYANKQLGEKTGWNHIMRAIRTMIETLSYIASKNDKKEKHDTLWGEIAEYLNA
jgi:hypothetical protein